MDYTIRAGAFSGIPEVLDDFKIDAASVFAQFGLSLDVLASPDTPICYRTFLNLMNTCAELTHCEDFGIRVAQHQELGMLGALGFAMKEAPDIRTAILDLCEFIHLKGAVSELHENDGLAIWSFRVVMPSPPDYRQQLMLSMGIGINWLRRLTSPKWRPEFVHQEYKEPENCQAFRKFCNSPISFNQELNAIMFDVELLDKTSSVSNDHLYQILREYLEQKAAQSTNIFIDEVRAKIMSDLQKGQCSIDSVSNAVGMKRRTFQRRLKDENCHFSDLLEDTRMDMAKRYLQLSDISLTQIADMLGYSEQAAFSRSFKRNAGKAPSLWRAQGG